MTSTDSKVTRVTKTAYRGEVGVSGRAYGKQRRLAITILPTEEIELRPLRLRKGVKISAERLYLMLKAEEVRERNAARAERKRPKQRKQVRRAK